MADKFAWTKYKPSHGYESKYKGKGTDTPHYAIDLPTPVGTPITALYGGTVIQADYAVWAGQPGGGEVFVKTPSGRVFYMYHLDQIRVRVGQQLKPGDLIGLSGGQNTGGSHPTSRMWSTGPHLHVGWFVGYVPTPEGNRPFGPDILPDVLKVAASGVGNGTITPGQIPEEQTTVEGQGLLNPLSPLTSFLTGLFTIQIQPTPYTPGSSYEPFLVNTGRVFFSMGTTTRQILNNVPGFYGICLALDTAEQFPGIVSCSTPDQTTSNYQIGNVDTGIPNPFATLQSGFGDMFCTVISTVTGNAMALGIRLLLILIGFGLLVALMLNISLSGDNVEILESTVGGMI